MAVAALLPLVGTLLDRLLPDPQAAAEAKIKMLEMAQKGELTELSEQASIVREEAKSEHWLAATWRPILMLTFGALIVARWLGYSAPGITEAEILKLWDIVELGLGGYVIGRSVEKVAPTLANAMKGK